MERIASFNVDHTILQPGVYISRCDDDIITYDLRHRRPNCGDFLPNITLHSVEHLFATIVRNSRLKDRIIYFGPMGCQTGFYLLVRHTQPEEVLSLIKETLAACVNYQGPMPGQSAGECGNYLTLSLDAAREECRRFAEVLKNWTVEKMIYPK